MRLLGATSPMIIELHERGSALSPKQQVCICSPPPPASPLCLSVCLSVYLLQITLPDILTHLNLSPLSFFALFKSLFLVAMSISVHCAGALC